MRLNWSLQSSIVTSTVLYVVTRQHKVCLITGRLFPVCLSLSLSFLSFLGGFILLLVVLGLGFVLFFSKAQYMNVHLDPNESVLTLPPALWSKLCLRSTEIKAT